MSSPSQATSRVTLPQLYPAKTEQLIGPAPSSPFRLGQPTVGRIAILPCLIHPTVGRIATSILVIVEINFAFQISLYYQFGKTF